MSKPKVTLIRRVNFWYYPLLLVPIVGVIWLALYNLVPSWALVIAIFAFFTWLFSLGFALFGLLTRKPPREPRQ